MATVITKTLNITESNAEQYCTASGLELNDGGHAFRKWLDGGTDGYAILNDAAKELLYPSAYARPFKLDSSIRGSRSAGSMTAALEFDGTAVHSVSFTSTVMKTQSSTGITVSAVTSSRRSTVIRWHINGANANIQRVETADITLYFQQYDFSVAIATGMSTNPSLIRDVRILKDGDSFGSFQQVAYEGESVTFSANLKDNAVFDGWYSDNDCTNLVSKDANYTVTASADLKLYAKASTGELAGTGAFIKRSGTWAEAQAVYKKISGAWVKQTDMNAVKTEIQNGNYIFKED